MKPDTIIIFKTLLGIGDIWLIIENRALNLLDHDSLLPMETERESREV